MKQWALTICVSCVLASGLELFLPKKEYTKSIKSVLALYILISILRPISDSSWSGFDFSSVQSNVTAVDYSAYQAELERTTLKASLEEQLSIQGVDGSITVDLGPPLMITVDTETPELANKILSKALEGYEDIVINSEDATNER